MDGDRRRFSCILQILPRDKIPRIGRVAMFYQCLLGIAQLPERVYWRAVSEERHIYPIDPFLVVYIEVEFNHRLPLPPINLTVLYLIHPIVEHANV